MTREPGSISNDELNDLARVHILGLRQAGVKWVAVTPTGHEVPVDIARSWRPADDARACRLLRSGVKWEARSLDDGSVTVSIDRAGKISSSTADTMERAFVEATLKALEAI